MSLHLDIQPFPFPHLYSRKRYGFYVYTLDGEDTSNENQALLAHFPFLESSLFLYVKNTNLWHRSDLYEKDFLFGPDEGSMMKVDSSKMRYLVDRQVPMDESSEVVTRMLNRFRSQKYPDVLTSERIGLWI